ncbi:MAG TPA: ABC transporter ATP-binding protein [Casimicrobiaceae bacterium]|jgi:NitT/TauT family transport system ATP-binding protein|nr:ABC transporter ATP-binding protein [Casimicrobiaceae bacterium]
MAAVKIAVDDVTIEYYNEQRDERHVAIAGLSMDIHASEFVCVLGSSGCGKSTLLSLIAGFLRPRSGTVTMDGRPITRPGADRGVVFQEYALLPWKNVRDNVALGLKFRGVPRAERERTADEFLKLTNLADAGDKFPFELSGGMKQRVALARTLANRPEVMLMDEPFAAVDAQTRMTLQEELLRLWNHSRVTVLFVTHSVDEAVFLADRVVVLTSGPGRVRASVAIDIPREDRTWNRLRQDERFSALCSDILALVRSPGASA